MTTKKTKKERQLTYFYYWEAIPIVVKVETLPAGRSLHDTGCRKVWVSQQFTSIFSVIIDALVSSFAEIIWPHDSVSILNHDAITICPSVV